MLSKEIDLALIGKNYLSLILSFNLLKRKRNVLLLDDQRIQYGEYFGHYLNELDVELLRNWGIDQDVNPLIKINRYLKRVPITISFNGRLIRLGDDPARNLKELLRKLPDHFSGGNVSEVLAENSEGLKLINEDFENLCQRLGGECYYFKNFQSVDANMFFQNTPGYIKSIFNSFMESYIRDGGEEGELSTFLFLIRSFFHKKFSNSANKIELFHIFLSMLSPLYKIDVNAFEKELIKVFENRGGQYKSTQIREWLFYNKKPWSMELASFDGIIHPKKLAFLGGEPIAMPLKLETLPVSYSCVEFKLRLSSLYRDREQVTLYTKSELIGTDKPFWIFNFSSDCVRVKCAISKTNASKIEFHRGEIFQQVSNIIYTLYRIELKNDDIYDFEFDPEVWIKESFSGKHFVKQDVLKINKVALIDNSVPSEKKHLKNVFYYGPMKESSLGLLSSLMEIKDARQYI